MKGSQNAIFLSVILLLAALLYSGAFPFPFYLDDEITILRNPRINDLGNFLFGDHWIKIHYRSTSFLSLAVVKQMVGTTPWLYRLVTLMLHLFNGWLVMQLVKKLMPKQDSSFPAIAAGAFFLLHPIQVQPLVYITQQMAVLATTFYLLGIHVYTWVRQQQVPNKVAMGIIGLALLFMLGFKAKQTMATFPITCLVLELFFGKKASGKKWVGGLLTLLVLGGLVALLLGVKTAETQSISRFTYFLTQIKVLGLYLKQVFLPVGFSLEHNPSLVTLNALSIGFWFSLGVHLLCVAAGFLFFQKKRIVSLGIVFFYVFHLIESSVFPIRDVMFEHRMYLPMVGLALVVAGCFSFVKQVWIRWVVFSFLLLLALPTYNAIQVWETPVKLWKNAIQQAPQKARPYVNLGMFYYQEHQLDSARKYFELGLATEPDHVEALNNLGALLVDEQNCEEAIHYLNRSIAINPSNKFAYNNLGVCWQRRGAVNHALGYVEKALRIDPFFSEALFNKAVLLEELKKPEAAIATYKTLIEIAPDYPFAHFNLGNALLKSGESAQAIKAFKKSVERMGESADVLGNMAISYYYEGDLEQAAKLTEKAIELDPERGDLRENLKVFTKKP